MNPPGELVRSCFSSRGIKNKSGSGSKIPKPEVRGHSVTELHWSVSIGREVYGNYRLKGLVCVFAGGGLAADQSVSEG